MIINGKNVTQESRRSFASAASIRGDRFVAVGSDSEALDYRGSGTKVIDPKGRTVIPGLNDSHTHFHSRGPQLQPGASVGWFTDARPSHEECAQDQVKLIRSGHCPFMFVIPGRLTFLNALYPQLAHVGSGSFANSSPVARVPHRTHSYIAPGKICFAFSFSSDISGTPDESRDAAH